MMNPYLSESTLPVAVSAPDNTHEFVEFRVVNEEVEKESEEVVWTESPPAVSIRSTRIELKQASVEGMMLTMSTEPREKMRLSEGPSPFHQSRRT